MLAAVMTEKLGHSGHDPDDLLDAVGQVERLLDGEDVDSEIEFAGMAAKVERLVKGSNATQTGVASAKPRKLKHPGG